MTKQAFLGRLRKRMVRPELGECWEFDGAKDEDGYGVVRDGTKIEKAHRLAYKLFVGPLEDGQVLLHRCDNPPCCRWGSHTFPGTQRDNMRDKVEKGRQVNVRLLGDEDVNDIREAASRGESCARLARRKGVSVSAVKSVASGQNQPVDLRRMTL